MESLIKQPLRYLSVLPSVADEIAHEKSHCVHWAQWNFCRPLCYTEAATAFTEANMVRGGGYQMTLTDFLLSLLNSVLGSILGALILQRLRR